MNTLPPPIARWIPELETLLAQLLAEHRKTVGYLDAQHAAMKTFNLDALDAARHQQDASRIRVAAIENKRKIVIAQLAKGTRLNADALTLAKLAELHAPRRDALLKLRADLKEVAETVTGRTKVAGRLAGALLGHMNTVVRLLAGAVEKAGIYTKHGVPQMSARIGVMEAVG